MAMSVAVLFLLSSVSSVLSQDPSAANNYETIYQTLARCSVPTEDIFKRTYDHNIDRGVPSDYDNFCSVQDRVNGFMCNYYRQLVGTYFKEYCNGKQRMDHSAQWLRFYSDPGQPCQYLVDNLRYQLDSGSLMNVFKDEAACQAICSNRNKFCLGFAFALQVYQSKSKEQLTDATITGSDGTNGAETGAEKTETVAIGDSPGSQTSQLANNVNTAAGDDTRKEDTQSPPDTYGGVNNPPPVNTATGTAEGVNDPAPVNTATGTAEGGNDLPPVNPDIGTSEGGNAAPTGLGTDTVQGGNAAPTGLGTGTVQDGTNVNEVPPSGAGEAVGSGEPHEPMNIPAGPPGKSEDETSPGGVSVSSPKEGVNGDQEEAGSQGDKEGKEPQEKEEHDLFDILRNNGNATADEANITVPLDNNSPLEPGDIQDENYGSSSDSYSVDLPFAKKPDAGDVDDFILPEDAHNDEQTVYQPEINQPVEQPEAKPEIKPSAQEHTNDRNIMKEEELRILEEESSSSHFLAYTLTAIILIMVTYIMYHNKQKIVAIIVEGKGGSNGRRRRYNQNV